MLGLLGFLLVVWLICAIVGALLKGMAWLLVLGVVLFIGTAVVGWVNRKALGRR